MSYKSLIIDVLPHQLPEEMQVCLEEIYETSGKIVSITQSMYDSVDDDTGTSHPTVLVTIVYEIAE